MKAGKMKVRSLAPLVLICCFAVAAPSTKAQQTFSFPNFDSVGGLTLNGAAAKASNGTVNVLRITPGTQNALGTVFYSTPFPLSQGFTTTFTFQFTGQGGDQGHADGIAFLVQNSPAHDMASGVLGGSIGYGDDDRDDDPADGISNSVAIEFDTYANGWDPNNNHVAIQSCGAANNTQHHNKLCPDHTNSTLQINAATGINLTDGLQHTAVVTYTPPCAGCLNLTVKLDGQSVLAAAINIASLGLGTNGEAFVGFTGSTGAGFENQDIISWNFTSNTIIEPVSTTAPTAFQFSTTPGTELTHTVDFTPPAGQLTYPLNDPTTIQIQSTNTSVDAITWPQFVTGGPLAPSILFPLADDNTSPTGTNGALFVDLCFDPTLTGNPAALTPSDANCPFVAAGSSSFLGINVIADLVSKPGIVPGTTTVLAHYEPKTTGTTTWSPSTINGTPNPACVVTTGSTSGTQPAPPTTCDVLDVQQAIAGDQTTSSGKSRGKGAFAFAYNVPMLLSTVKVNGTQINTPPTNINAASAGLWFSAAHAPLSLSFLVNPACPLGSATCPPVPNAANNFFSAAPVAGETFDVTNLAGTTTIVPTTAGTPPLNFNTASVQPVTFTGTLTGGQLPDGQYLLQWSAFDNVGILEQNQQLVQTPTNTNCPDGTPASEGACYVTTLFSAQLNVDSTPPTITPTFTPASSGNIFAVGSTVQVHFGCNDTLSGIATCVSTGVSGLTDNGAVNTSALQIGTHTFTITATDKAGNSTMQSVTYQIVGSSELLLVNFASPTVTQGSNLTYSLAVLNLGPSVANNVIVTDTLPVGTSFVSAGYGIVSCMPWGCSDMNGPGSACSISGTTVTCKIPTVGLLFKNFTGALVKIVVKVNNTTTPGTILSDTATVAAVNTDPFHGDNSATARTEVCSSTAGCPRLR
jgi:uncharacterized repeat protein (TIGR01451 family)